MGPPHGESLILIFASVEPGDSDSDRFFSQDLNFSSPSVSFLTSLVFRFPFFVFPPNLFSTCFQIDCKINKHLCHHANPLLENNQILPIAFRIKPNHLSMIYKVLHSCDTDYFPPEWFHPIVQPYHIIHIS